MNIDNFHLEFADDNLYTFEISGRKRDVNDSSQKNFTDWTANVINVDDWVVIPFGEDNDLPLEVQEPIFASNQGKRIQSRKAELLWGIGPELYTIDRSGKIPIRNYIEDVAIQDWLDSFDYTEILQCLIEDYYYTEVLWHKIFTDRGARIGSSSSIAKLDFMGVEKCRLCYKKSNKLKLPTHVMVADWSDSQRKSYKVYPLFNPLEPEAFPVSISYIRKKSFATPFYAIPDVYGSLAWIKRSNAIPFILEALTNNTLNIKWHITSPASYWEAKQKMLEKNAKLPGAEPYKDSDLEDLKVSILKKISDLLSGVDNVGKFWHNEKVIKVLGATQVEHNWDIKPIEQKVKDFITSQLEIAKYSDFASASAMGLHTSLANIGADGKSDSGSEQLYALQGHQKTNTKVPEHFVTKLLNLIIKHKFGKDVKIGFRYEEMQREEDKTPNDRSKNISA